MLFHIVTKILIHNINIFKENVNEGVEYAILKKTKAFV